ncbi:MAG: hypothetical protein FWE96_04655 [Coriobacteriia bacterium]|nr:hypothetical protein [Coriobacteriia bacterium]
MKKKLLLVLLASIMALSFTTGCVVSPGNLTDNSSPEAGSTNWQSLVEEAAEIGNASAATLGGTADIVGSYHPNGVSGISTGPTIELRGTQGSPMYAALGHIYGKLDIAIEKIYDDFIFRDDSVAGFNVGESNGYVVVSAYSFDSEISSTYFMAASNYSNAGPT